MSQLFLPKKGHLATFGAIHGGVKGFFQMKLFHDLICFQNITPFFIFKYFQPANSLSYPYIGIKDCDDPFLYYSSIFWISMFKFQL